jgi:hypothetical protein
VKCRYAEESAEARAKEQKTIFENARKKDKEFALKKQLLESTFTRPDRPRSRSSEPDDYDLK